MFAEWLVLWAFLNLGLFIAAAGIAFVSVASHRIAERLGAGWQTWAQRSRWVAQALTLLLVVDVLGMTLTLVVFFLLPRG